MRLAVTLVAILALGPAGCGKSKPAAEPPRSCKTNADCDQGWVCLADKCADPRGKAVYVDPANAVTPDKMKDHVEKIEEDHGKAMDEKLKKAEEGL